MKRLYTLLLTVLLLVLIAIPSASYAAQTAVNLGATSTFAGLQSGFIAGDMSIIKRTWSKLG